MSSNINFTTLIELIIFSLLFFGLLLLWKIPFEIAVGCLLGYYCGAIQLIIIIMRGKEEPATEIKLKEEE